MADSEISGCRVYEKLEPLSDNVVAYLAMGSRSKDIVMCYLDALSNQDFIAARGFLSDNMTFQSPVSSQESADAYFKDMERLRSQSKIKAVLYDVKKVFLDGDDVCVFFDFNAGSATIFAAGWFHVKDGKISSIRVVFDPRPISPAP